MLLIAFVPGSAWWLFVAIIAPYGIGSHASVYADAARAWLGGGDPWRVGPPDAVFAGPPTMLLPFVPFTLLGWDLTRIAWVTIDAVAAVWALRRFGLPAYWLIFPPLFESIVLGHPEVLLLASLAVRHPIAGLATFIKPYVALPLLAERRFRALALAAAAAIITVPFLPWVRFIEAMPQIGATLARQNVGDGVFGQPALMVIAALALASLGLRRALWLAVPVLWPFAQPVYKTMTIPALSPIVALAWAIPIQGATLVGIVALAGLVQAERRWALPAWLRAGIAERSTLGAPRGATEGPSAGEAREPRPESLRAEAV